MLHPHPSRPLKSLSQALVFILLTGPLFLYGQALLRRPQAQNQPPQPLFQGITYQRQIQSRPSPLLIHQITIDLTAPGIRPWVTPSIETTDPAIAATLPSTGPNNPERRETLAQESTLVLAKNQLQLVINANFFFPFKEDSPWRTTPSAGAPTSLVGTAIAQGKIISQPQEHWPALCFLSPPIAQGRSSEQSAPTPPQANPQESSQTSPKASIVPSGICPPGTQAAVSGNLLLIDQGKPGAIKAEADTQKPYPMVIAALDQSGQQLQLIIVDGKQPFYSEGITLSEAIALLQQTSDIHNAIRLDGGGSTSLVVQNHQGQPEPINAVIQAKIPGRERPVANHLGFYALPLATPPTDPLPSRE